MLLLEWKVLGIQRLQFMEEALTGTPITQSERQRLYEVRENLPAMQDPVRGWERQETIIDNGSTADSGVATVSPADTSGTVRSPFLPNIFNLALKRYRLDYPVSEHDNGEGVDVGNKDDDGGEDFVDDENKENVQLVTFTPEQERDNQPLSVELRRCNGVPFE